MLELPGIVMGFRSCVPSAHTRNTSSDLWRATQKIRGSLETEGWWQFTGNTENKWEGSIKMTDV
jgi:hypothetical protein